MLIIYIKTFLLITIGFILWKRKEGRALKQKEGTDRTSNHISDSAFLLENLSWGLSGGRGVLSSAKILWKVERRC